MFKALLIDDTQDPAKGRIAELDPAELPEGGVTVDVAYSSLNHKDALGVLGRAPIARKFPMIAGIDLAGSVAESTDPRFAVGDEVVATGFGLGEKHWGGLSERARLDGDWLARVPDGLSLRDAMAVGTAGLTAMLCVMALERQGIGDGEVLVTGANGGVGSFGVLFLAALGKRVVASTGRLEESDYLKQLGADEVIDRDGIGDAGRILSKERWAGAVDVVGGETLATVCASLKYGATAAACGNAGGMKLPTSVAPFILRGITLAGVDSVYAPADVREEAWRRIATADRTAMSDIAEQIGLSEVLTMSERLLDGTVRGRLVVDVKS